MTPFIYLRLSRTDTELYFTRFTTPIPRYFGPDLTPSPHDYSFLSFLGPSTSQVHFNLTFIFFLVWATNFTSPPGLSCFPFFSSFVAWHSNKQTPPRECYTLWFWNHCLLFTRHQLTHPSLHWIVTHYKEPLWAENPLVTHNTHAKYLPKGSSVSLTKTCSLN